MSIKTFWRQTFLWVQQQLRKELEKDIGHEMTWYVLKNDGVIDHKKTISMHNFLDDPNGVKMLAKRDLVFFLPHNEKCIFLFSTKASSSLLYD